MRALLVPALVLALTACAEAVTPEGTAGGADAGTGDASTDAGDAGSGGSSDAAGDAGSGGGALDGGADATPHTDAGPGTDAGAGSDAGPTTDAGPGTDASTDAGTGADASDDARTDAGDILAALRSDTDALIDELIATQYARAQVSCDCLGDDVGSCIDHFAVSFDPAMACTRQAAADLDLETLRKAYDAMTCDLARLQTSLACEDAAACDPDATDACATPSSCEDLPGTMLDAITTCVDAG